MCFRAVLDGALSSNASGGARCTEWASSKVCRRQHIQRLLQEKFGVGKIRLSRDRSKTYTPVPEAADASAGAAEASQRTESAGWDGLHADYYEREGYVFSAVLHLGAEAHDEVPLIGGETGVADELERDATTGAPRLARGMIVEPRRGRLMLFTGGGENYHAPLQVMQGRRTTYHAWFACDCDERRPAVGHSDDDASVAWSWLLAAGVCCLLLPVVLGRSLPRLQGPVRPLGQSAPNPKDV